MTRQLVRAMIISKLDIVLFTVWNNSWNSPYVDVDHIMSQADTLPLSQVVGSIKVVSTNAASCQCDLRVGIKVTGLTAS